MKCPNSRKHHIYKSKIAYRLFARARALKTVTIKVPVPPQLLVLYLVNTKFTEKEALNDFQKTIQTLIDKMFPKIFATLNDAVLALETRRDDLK